MPLADARTLSRATIGLILVALLVGCGGSRQLAGNSTAAVPTETPLPTVTPLLRTAPAERPSTPSRAAPTPSPPPSASAAPAVSEGVTPSMARLEIAAESYGSLGDPAAPVTIVEYLDYGCPFCRLYEAQTFPMLRERYIDTGDVFYVYKDFPVVSEQGGLAAQVAECAGEQARYWEMHARLFADPREWDTSPDRAQVTFRDYAARLKLDETAFAECLATGRQQAEVQADFEEGLRLGINGTPAFVIDGKLLSGAQSSAAFVQAIEEALATR